MHEAHAASSAVPQHQAKRERPRRADKTDKTDKTDRADRADRAPAHGHSERVAEQSPGDAPAAAKAPCGLQADAQTGLKRRLGEAAASAGEGEGEGAGGEGAEEVEAREEPMSKKRRMK